MSLQTENQPAIHSSFADDEMMSELVEMFVDEIPERVKTLEDAYAASDLELLRRTAHQLKGAFGSYGFETLTAPARNLEYALDKNALLDEVRQHLDVLIGMCGRMSSAPGPC